MADIYDYVTSPAKVQDLSTALWPGQEQEDEMPQTEHPLIHLMSSRFAHRITTSREMGRIAQKQVPYSGRTRGRED